MKRLTRIALAMVACGLLSAPAFALTFTATGTNPAPPGTSLAAQVDFTIDVDGNLQVVLTNTALSDVMIPSDVLTAVFFDIVGDPALTPLSALLTGGSTVFFDPGTPGGVVGGEWAYASALGGAPLGALQGISSAGFGLFGAATFPGANLQGPPGVDGLQYGITSAGDNPLTGNAPVTGSNALIQNQVTFTLGGLPGTFSLADISNVSFQYGTALNEPNIHTGPEPGVLLFVGLGLLGAAAGRRRRS